MGDVWSHMFDRILDLLDDPYATGIVSLLVLAAAQYLLFLYLF